MSGVRVPLPLLPKNSQKKTFDPGFSGVFLLPDRKPRPNLPAPKRSPPRKGCSRFRSRFLAGKMAFSHPGGPGQLAARVAGATSSRSAFGSGVSTCWWQPATDLAVDWASPRCSLWLVSHSRRSRSDLTETLDWPKPAIPRYNLHVQPVGYRHSSCCIQRFNESPCPERSSTGRHPAEQRRGTKAAKVRVNRLSSGPAYHSWKRRNCVRLLQRRFAGNWWMSPSPFPVSGTLGRCRLGKNED